MYTKKKKKKNELLCFYSIFFFVSLDFFGLLLLTTRKMYRQTSMKTLLLLLPVCVSLILFPVLGEDEDIGVRRFFLSVLAIVIQKQTEILREKTSRGVLVIQLCQKSPRYRGDIALNRAEIAEWFTRATLKLQLLGDKNCVELRRQKSPV